MRSELNIPHKANRILNLVLLAFLLILVRVWYLGFVQGDYHREQSRKPQRRSSIEKVERATIRDRFNIPLAQNKIDYAVAIRYADIRDIPSHKWKMGPDGKKVKEAIRGPYITSLANLLAKELQMDASEIEDIIYAKASLFPHTPFIIKESLQETQYYRIRRLQKDWVGIEAERNSKRIYPQGKTSCDVVGYMGAISSHEYLQIAEEIKELEQYIKKREAGEIVFLPLGHENPLEVRKRLTLLKEKAYTINDLVGKTGIESSYDESLRGIHGKKIVEIDPKGNILRELPGAKKGVSGERVFLSISSELQHFAEALLAQHEEIRDIKNYDQESIPGVPWIKGGAIVALDPKTGEVLALASYPRLDPNDFVQSQNPLIKERQQQSVRRWIETETHIGEIWGGKVKMERENFSTSKNWKTDSLPFTWKYFLSTILPPESSLERALNKIGTVKNAYFLQSHFETIMKQMDVSDPAAIIQALYPEEPHNPCKKKFSSDLLQFLQNKINLCEEQIRESVLVLNTFLTPLSYNDDKLLALDLIRLLMVTDMWNSTLIDKVGDLSLSSFFELSQSFSLIQEVIKEKTRQLHKELDFKNWREKHFKNFLKQKRKEEKAKKTYTRPYTEHLEKVEKALFKSFWNSCKYLFLDAAIFGKQRISLEEYPQLNPYIESLERPMSPFLIPHLYKLQKVLSSLSPVESSDFLKAMRTFEELNRPLYGKYRLVRNTKGVQLEKHLAASFYPLSGFGYGRSQAFRQSTPQGSIFKLVIAYEALKERYEYLKENSLNLRDLNPLTLVDEPRMNARAGSGKQILGYTLDGKPIQRLYKGGMLPRGHAGVGKIDLPQAIENSSNIYFSILASEHVADPILLEKATRDLGFGAKTGIELQGEISGNIPSDLADNKTGLYSFAMGQHSLVVTPLQTAVMLAALGNEGKVLKPQIISLTAGKNREDASFVFNPERAYPFQDPLSLVGIYFPFFTELLSSSYNPCVRQTEPEIIRSFFFPPEIKSLIFEGMDKVITGKKGTARAHTINYLRGKPKETKDYIDLQGQLIGKTGTAEILYKQWLDAESQAQIHNHIWFGGLVFPEGETFETGDAELAVVVYLRFSQAGGKEAAPLAAQVAKKWREIQKNHGGSSYLEKQSP